MAQRLIWRWTPEWVVPLLIALGSLLVSGYVAYAHNDRDLNSRISVVEQQQKSDSQPGGRLDRIENKVDKVLEKMAGW